MLVRLDKGHRGRRAAGCDSDGDRDHFSEQGALCRVSARAEAFLVVYRVDFVCWKMNIWTPLNAIQKTSHAKRRDNTLFCIKMFSFFFGFPNLQRLQHLIMLIFVLYSVEGERDTFAKFTICCEKNVMSMICHGIKMSEICIPVFTLQTLA